MSDQVEIQLMREKAEAVQAVVSEVGSMDEAFRYTAELTRREGGSTVAAPGLAAEELEALGRVLGEHDLVLLEPPLRDHLEGIHTALTRVPWGVAETGTLVLDSSSEDVRIATMLAETHVAVVPRSGVHPDLESLADELGGLMHSGPRYLSFITGASRTADIERVLTIGVHGPKALHILILEE